MVFVEFQGHTQADIFPSSATIRTSKGKLITEYVLYSLCDIKMNVPLEVSKLLLESSEVNYSWLIQLMHVFQLIVKSDALKRGLKFRKLLSLAVFIVC